MTAGAPFAIRSGQPVDRSLLGGSHVFIVTQGIATKVVVNRCGRSSEVGMIGREGMFPMGALLGVDNSPHILVARVGKLTGRVLRVKDFHAAIDRSAQAREKINRYVYSFISQIATNLMSGDQNPVAARICRWLLMCHDRIDGDVIPVTHDSLADMSFAHRPTVTRELNRIREEGFIRTARGSVEVVSREGLKSLANGSYGMAADYYARHIAPFGKG